MSPAIAARAVNTNIAVSRRTTQRRLPHGPKRQPKRLLERPKHPPRSRHGRQNRKRISLGRRPRLAASRFARGRHVRWVAASRDLAHVAWLSSTYRRWCCRHRHQTEGNATRRSHPPDGSGATRSPGARHHFCLPRVSSTLRRLTRDRSSTKRRTQWRSPFNEIQECWFSRFG
jgi:hypothetical protein